MALSSNQKRPGFVSVIVRRVLLNPRFQKIERKIHAEQKKERER